MFHEKIKSLFSSADMNPQAPTASALNQQRAKLKPEAMEMVFRHFNSFTDSLDRATTCT